MAGAPLASVTAATRSRARRPSTDSSASSRPVSSSGLALHQEFDELARAGLSPLRVLQMTTWNAAEFMSATNVMGSVAAGKHANLVLLDANPVESVDHLHRIRGVVRGGRYLGPADLGALKEKVAATRSAR